MISVVVYQVCPEFEFVEIVDGVLQHHDGRVSFISYQTRQNGFWNADRHARCL